MTQCPQGVNLANFLLQAKRNRQCCLSVRALLIFKANLETFQYLFTMCDIRKMRHREHSDHMSLTQAMDVKHKQSVSSHISSVSTLEAF